MLFVSYHTFFCYIEQIDVFSIFLYQFTQSIIILMQQAQYSKSSLLRSHKLKSEENVHKNIHKNTDHLDTDQSSTNIKKIHETLKKPLELRTGSQNLVLNKFIQQNLTLKKIAQKVSKQFVKNIMKRAQIAFIPKNKVLAEQQKSIKQVGIVIDGKVNVYKKQTEGYHYSEINKQDIWLQLIDKSAKQIKLYKKMSKIISESPPQALYYKDKNEVVDILKDSKFQYSLFQNQQYGTQDLALGNQYISTSITQQQSIILIIQQDYLIICLQQALKQKIKILTAQLKKIKCFSFLQTQKINPIIQNLSLHKIKRGQKVYSQNEEATEFFILVNGEVRLQKYTKLFEENPNQLYRTRSKLIEETVLKGQKRSQMNKKQGQYYDKKLKRAILPYANLNRMYNYQPQQKNIEIAVLNPFCLFGQEQFIQNKKREASAVCASLQMDYYIIKVKKIEQILGNKVWPTFKNKIRESVTKKILYRQSQYASNLQFQNKTHMNYFYMHNQQQVQSPRKVKLLKFNRLLQAPTQNTPQRSYSRGLQRYSQPLTAPPRYTVFNFNQLMKKQQKIEKTDGQQVQFSYKNVNQLKIMNVSHTWKLMKQKVDQQQRTSKKISPNKPVINLKYPLIQNQYFIHIDKEKKKIQREHRKRVLSLGRSLQLKKNSFSNRK